MVDINLLPTDIAPKSPVNRAANLIKRIAIYGAVALIVFLLGIGGYIVYLQSQIRSSVSNQAELENSIRLLEQAEQSLVLLKDRIRRANTVLAKDTATPALENFEELTLVTSQGVGLTDAEINTEVSEVSYIISSSSQLVQLMAGVFSIEAYERIELTSFGFSPTSGYLVGLEMR